MSVVFVVLVLVAVWTLGAIAYVVIRDHRWHTERHVLCDVLNNTHAELVASHDRCTRGERERTRILCTVHKFQHARPKLGDAIDLAIGEEAH